MTARNNTFLHSLNPEIFKKWIFFSSSVKGILTCCIMHNFPQVITNIKTKKNRLHILIVLKLASSTEYSCFLYTGTNDM